MLDCNECSYEKRAKMMNKFHWREFTGEMPKGYDWVLVCEEKGNKPMIAEYSNYTHTWHTDDNHEDEHPPFESWFKVKYWKPIYDEAVPCCGLSEEEWNEIMC